MTIFRFLGYGSGGPVGAEFLWNANGDLVSFDAQPPGGFDGMAVANVALAGPGPFDSERRALKNSTVALLRVIQRVPSTAPSTTEIEFYRLRAGVVTSLGTVSLDNTSQFQSGSSAPTPGTDDIAVGDVFFVAFHTTPGLDASDLTAFLELVP